MTPKTPRSYIPPRPNLGIEPWPHAANSWILPVGSAIGALLIGLLVIRSRRIKTKFASQVSSISVESWPAAADELRRRLGNDSVARTSEELLGAIPTRISAEERAFIAEILTKADLIKFANLEAPSLTPTDRLQLDRLWHVLGAASTPDLR